MNSPRPMVGFINVAHFIDHFVLLIFPTAVLAMGSELGGDYGARLALATGSFLAFGVLSLPAGWLGDRWSRRHMLAVFFLGTGLACIATGLAQSLAALAAGLTMIGVFAAIYHPVGTAMLVAATGASGRAMGLNGVFGNLGVAFAAMVTGLLAQLWGWRAAFVVPGVVSLLVGLAYLVSVPAGSGEVPVAAHKARAPARGDGLLIALALAVTVAAGGLTFNGAVIAVPKLVDERLPALAPQAAAVGAVATAIYLAGALTQLVVGRLVERVNLGAIFVALGVMQALGLLGIAVLPGAAGLAMAALVLAAVYGQVVVNDMIIARAVPDAWRARAYAVRYVLGFTSSTLALPLIAWLHTPERGLGPVFAVLALFGAAVAAAACLYLGATRRTALVRPAE
ncbi:MFS transporter [Chelatococcus sp. SYSU_G07232]|uniref:MFS transporter n=1 Tax=Chelatococcus albus TaxID=3047466 RepID=A0ABT7ADC4_9HYPH|nr:MFS transporter [Chelatococcus sp. SYSU_G07232]MDJ1157382.1 MFS transporter [Chelatococcus sp. SYSU_G07232]